MAVFMVREKKKVRLKQEIKEEKIKIDNNS
jgi:hypothetical protein